MKTEYKDYTIEPTEHLYKNMVMFYPTASGIDCDFDGENWRTNVQYADTTQEAMVEIDDLMLMAEIDHELYLQERKAY